MTLFETPFHECLIYTLCVYGVYILFRQLKFPDISTDNVFSFGSITFAYFLTVTHNFFFAILLTSIGGFIIGCFTSLLYEKLRIPKLLCGIITYSMLFSINLKFFGRPNISLMESSMPSSVQSTLVIINLIIISFIVLLYMSRLGKAMNTFGNNPSILREFNAPSTLILLLGSGISNALICVSGGLTSSYFGFSDVSIGTGLLINSVAAIVISENIMQYLPRRYYILVIPLGVFLYNLILFLVITYLSFGFLDYTDYKLISGIVIILFFLASNRKAKEIISF